MFENVLEEIQKQIKEIHAFNSIMAEKMDMLLSKDVKSDMTSKDTKSYYDRVVELAEGMKKPDDSAGGFADKISKDTESV